MNKFSFALSSGLAIKKDSNLLSPNLYLNTEVASRYMFNSNHGIKLDIGFIPLNRDFNYTNFNKSFLLSFSAQYILDFGRLFHFEKFAPRFSGLLRVGGGISALKYKESFYFKNWKNNNSDETINLVLGLRPQYKLSEKVALHLDLGYFANIFQDFNQGFNFNDFTSQSKLGRITQISFGGTFYIGKEKQHSDWYWKTPIIEELKDSIPIIKQDSIVVAVYDTDKDGILNDEDMCPEEFGVKEFEGCPKPELTFDCYLDEFPVFQFNKARHDILDIYNPIIDSIAKCMLENSTKKIIIYGYTDNYGDSIYTNELSINRADVIRKAIVLKGIAPERIFVLGEGTKKATLPENEQGKIKHNRVAYIESISNNQNDIKELESGTFLQGLFFTVQIGAYQKAIKNNKFSKYGKVLVAVSPDKLTRYSIDVFQNYEDAYEKWKIIRKTNHFQDAYVTAYFLGERITIKKAQELLLQKGSDIIQK